ncbi:hypothetical protein T459_15803 [Capsicum annuum]|uniref:Uncharacterized protein n=1 Tax=Capsicum annuum TaxID=4072 RepID=A0A2G2Z768_CAPAN|nr:hypothetical protein T459_15803 [Capsicum annuum]
MHREIESNIRCYEPLVVSIGPFHRGKPELQLMEKRKELLAIQFADQDSTKERPEGVLPWLLTNSVSIDELYKKVKNIMPNVKVLMSCKFKNNEGMGMIKKFISSAHTKPIISSAHTKPTPPHRFIQGIKDFFLDLFGDTQKVMSFLGKICGEEGPPFTKQESMKNRLPAHLFELLKTHLIDPNAFSEGGCYLRALLTLPPLTIDDSTKSEFLNLVAYETRPDTPDDFGITSYLTFMDSLIDHAEDVKELRSKGILLNSFGTDEEVANLFKEIAQNLVPNPHAFFDAKLKIEQQYSSRRKAWIAELKNTHFAGPWTFLAFIAALFVIALQVAGLVLSAFQTYYAGHDKKGCIPNDLTKQGKPMTLSKLMSSLSISPSNNPDFHRLTPIVVSYGLLILQKHEDNNVDDGDDGDWFRNEDPNAFYTAYGDLFWSKLSRDTSSGNWFHANMARDSQSFINVLIGNEFKDVFRGLTSLVDVGGEMVLLQWP